MKACIGLSNSPCFGNFGGGPMSRMPGTVSVGFFPPFFAGLSELSGFRQVGNAVGIVVLVVLWYFLFCSHPDQEVQKHNLQLIVYVFLFINLNSLPSPFFFLFVLKDLT